MPEAQQEWRPDPFGRHEERYFSLGKPTYLVRDHGVDSHDEPPPPWETAHEGWSPGAEAALGAGGEFASSPAGGPDAAGGSAPGKHDSPWARQPAPAQEVGLAHGLGAEVGARVAPPTGAHPFSWLWNEQRGLVIAALFLLLAGASTALLVTSGHTKVGLPSASHAPTRAHSSHSPPGPSEAPVSSTTPTTTPQSSSGSTPPPSTTGQSSPAQSSQPTTAPSTASPSGGSPSNGGPTQSSPSGSSSLPASLDVPVATPDASVPIVLPIDFGAVIAAGVLVRRRRRRIKESPATGS